MSDSDKYLKLVEELGLLMLDETEFGIITALRWYGSMNLKRISKLIQRPESTTLRFIRKLRDNKSIEFDSEKSERSWGNFYKLSDKVRQLYEGYMNHMDERVERISLELKDLDKISDEELEKYFAREVVNPGKLAEIPTTKAYFNFIANLQKLIVNETMESVESLKELAEKEGYEEIKDKIILPPMDVSTYVSALKVSKIRHVLRISDLVVKFDRDIDKLAKEIIAEMDKDKVPEEDRITQFVNVFTGSLDISFSLKE